jgi:hypothetical protein
MFAWPDFVQLIWFGSFSDKIVKRDACFDFPPCLSRDFTLISCVVLGPFGEYDRFVAFVTVFYSNLMIIRRDSAVGRSRVVCLPDAFSEKTFLLFSMSMIDLWHFLRSVSTDSAAVFAIFSGYPHFHSYSRFSCGYCSHYVTFSPFTVRFCLIFLLISVSPSFSLILLFLFMLLCHCSSALCFPLWVNLYLLTVSWPRTRYLSVKQERVLHLRQC